MSLYESLIENKPNLFTIIMFTVIGILAIPIIAPHVLHTFQIFHIFIHLSGISLAAFLSTVSSIAYARMRTKKLFLTLLAFSFFTIGEALALVDAAWQYTYYLGPYPAGEIGHFFTLCALGMFTLSVFRKD